MQRQYSACFSVFHISLVGLARLLYSSNVTMVRDEQRHDASGRLWLFSRLATLCAAGSPPTLL